MNKRIFCFTLVFMLLCFAITSCIATHENNTITEKQSQQITENMSYNDVINILGNGDFSEEVSGKDPVLLYRMNNGKTFHVSFTLSEEYYKNADKNDSYDLFQEISGSEFEQIIQDVMDYLIVKNSWVSP